MKDETKKTIETLMYRMKRYQAMGNGTMCQALGHRLSKLQQQPRQGKQA